MEVQCRFRWCLALSLIALVVILTFALIRAGRKSSVIRTVPFTPPPKSSAEVRAERELELKKPFFRREVVEAKVKVSFPKHAQPKY